MRRFLVLPFALLAVAASAVAQVAAPSVPPVGKKLALLVGVNNYEFPKISKLKFCVNDIDLLEAFLLKQGYETVALTDTAGDKDAARKPTRENILKAMKTVIGGAKKTDQLFVAFAGHGCQFPNQKDGWFLPVDAKPFADKLDTMISLGAIYQELDQSSAGMKVLVVDACRNEPPPTETTRGVFVETLPVPKGIAAMFACSNGETALEADELKQGVFMYHLLRGLKGEAAGRDGKVTFGRLADYVQLVVPEDVKRRTMGKTTQSPNIRADISGTPPVIAQDVTSGEFRPGLDTGAWAGLAKLYPPVVPRMDRHLYLDATWFSPDGKDGRVFLYKNNPTDREYVARLYDLNTGEPVGPAIKTERPIYKWAYNPDGKRVALMMELGQKRVESGRFYSSISAQIYDAITSKQCGANLLRDSESRDQDLRFTPDGISLLISMEKKMQRVDVRSGKVIYDADWNLRFGSDAISPDGQYLWSIDSANKWNYIINMRTGNELCKSGMPDWHMTLIFHPNGKEIFRYGRGVNGLGCRSVSDLSLNRLLHKDQRVISLSFDGKAENHSCIFEFYPYQDAEVRPDYSTQLYTSEQPDSLREIKESGYDSGWYSNASRFDESGKMIMILYIPHNLKDQENRTKKMFRIYDVKTGKPVAPLLPRTEDTEGEFCFTPDGKQVVFWRDSEASVWDVATQKVVRRIEMNWD